MGTGSGFEDLSGTAADTTTGDGGREEAWNQGNDHTEATISGGGDNWESAPVPTAPVTAGGGW